MSNSILTKFSPFLTFRQTQLKPSKFALLRKLVTIFLQQRDPHRLLRLRVWAAIILPHTEVRPEVFHLGIIVPKHFLCLNLFYLLFQLYLFRWWVVLPSNFSKHYCNVNSYQFETLTWMCLWILRMLLKCLTCRLWVTSQLTVRRFCWQNQRSSRMWRQRWRGGSSFSSSSSSYSSFSSSSSPASSGWTAVASIQVSDVTIHSRFDMRSKLMCEVLVVF